MYVKMYAVLPDEAKHIRQEVFINEQKFTSEFDETDKTALHIVIYNDNIAIGTARIFQEKDQWIIGRVAVVKEFRKHGAGSFLMTAAEKEIKSRGGTSVRIFAQKRAEKFYSKLGYIPTGNTGYDEYCEHLTMIKEL